MAEPMGGLVNGDLTAGPYYLQIYEPVSSEVSVPFAFFYLFRQNALSGSALVGLSPRALLQTRSIRLPTCRR